ncbi:MAG: chemotaxis protein CheA [Acidobacteria bacterium]|nr:chemotaxis protein CheA [Acidobacteriota bacterium]
MTQEAFPDFLDDYFAECDEHLTGVRRLLLALENSVGRAEINRAVLDELFRHFHSLKGISGMVELRQAEDLAHRLEDYLRVLRKGDAILSADGMDALFDGAQMLEQVVNVRRSGGTFPAIGQVARRIEQLVAAPAVSDRPAPAAAAGTDAADANVPEWRCTFSPSAELVARGIRVDTVRARLAGIGHLLDAIPRVAADGSIAFDFILAGRLDAATLEAWEADGIQVERVVAEAAVSPSPQLVDSVEPETLSAGTAASSHFVRVDLARLDDLMRNIGDLVISRARLTESLSRAEAHVPAADWRVIQDNAIAIDRQLRTLREGIMRVRLVPVGEIFRRMPFVVRDLARETGKRVRMELQGQNTEIDKFLIERMMDPVLHLVRNAVSHGVETVEQRLAAGKRPEGTIVLSAATAGDIVRIDIADDGSGVDVAAVIARARQAGLPLPAGEPDAAAILALLCAPGFSTRDASDRASGRGVGMSVVQAAVHELSGTLRLETEKGTGTRFVIELPVTLAITDALIAKVGDETFAVPQGAIREVIEVAVGALLQVERNEMTPYRGAALPVIRLSRLFGLPDTVRDRLHLFVVGTGAGALGIAVDRIVGQREIVVRAIADALVRVDGISGATDLGDGHVVLILDPAVLARQMRERPDRILAARGAKA